MIRTCICKKRWRTAYFTIEIGEKCKYKIDYIKNNNITFELCCDIYINDNIYQFGIEAFHVFFYTEKELRKIKLERLKQCI